jgi:uncharacterized protein (DUF1684 family)
MKRFLSAYLLLIIACHNPPPSSYQKQVEQLHAEQAASFRDPATSPLDEEERKAFKGLSFFNVDEQYHITATLTRTPDLPFFEMPHSNNRTYAYQKFGVITFTLNGTTFTLPVYSNESLRKDKLVFFPFTDLTNGKETYGGGRYLDLHYSDTSGTTEVDFNLCYQPYCAHSHRYSCPIVPKENHLDIAIRAGEKL